MGSTRCAGCKGKAVLLVPRRTLPRSRSRSDILQSSHNHQPVFSRARTQPSLLLVSQFSPFSGFMVVLNSNYFSCFLNLCFAHFPSAIIPGSGVSQQLLELSNARLPSPGEPTTFTGTSASGRLRNRQNWEPSASSWPLAGERGFPCSLGRLRMAGTWVLSDPFDAAQG